MGGATSHGKFVVQPICSSSPYNASTYATPPPMTTTLALTTSTTDTSTMGTMGSTSTSVLPLLFCLMVLDTSGPELQLVREQIHQGVGIFACDEFAVFSEIGDVSLGMLPKGRAVDVTTTWFQKADVWYHKKTKVDALLYMNVWDAVRNDGRYRRHDWTIKVDPSTVVLPGRLRERLAHHTSKNCYILGCDVGSFGGHVGPSLVMLSPGTGPSLVMLGPLEVFSRQAVDNYLEGNAARCRGELQWSNWAEAEFMSRCLDLLGVPGVNDAGLLSDDSCNGGEQQNCQDRTSVAYHSSLSIAIWFDCWGQANLF